MADGVNFADLLHLDISLAAGSVPAAYWRCNFLTSRMERPVSRVIPQCKLTVISLFSHALARAPSFVSASTDWRAVGGQQSENGQTGTDFRSLRIKPRHVLRAHGAHIGDGSISQMGELFRGEPWRPALGGNFGFHSHSPGRFVVNPPLWRLRRSALLNIDTNGQGYLKSSRSLYRSRMSRSGSSSNSFTRTRNVTASLPSTMRWS